MNQTRQFIVPVIGMTCLGCAGSVEVSSKQASAVEDATVNLASERLTLTIDSTQEQANEVLAEVRHLVKRAGYKIPTLTLTLPIIGMSCTACVSAVEQALREVDGVVYASVNFAAEQAHVEYVSGLGARAPLVAAVRRSRLRYNRGRLSPAGHAAGSQRRRWRYTRLSSCAQRRC